MTIGMVSPITHKIGTRRELIFFGILAAIVKFKQIVKISDSEEAGFRCTDLSTVHDFLASMQTKQEQSSTGLMNMGRVRQFLASMTNYCKISEKITDDSDVAIFIWVSAFRLGHLTMSS